LDEASPVGTFSQKTGAGAERGNQETTEGGADHGPELATERQGAVGTGEVLVADQVRDGRAQPNPEGKLHDRTDERRDL
jgi:hypothetical protein